jgi:protein-L-isoaspartate(D-aspartate) O-methyltransferase
MNGTLRRQMPSDGNDLNNTKRKRNTGFIGLAGLIILTLLALAILPLPAQDSEGEYQKRREAMVETKIKTKGIDDLRILDALRTTPRHLFIPDYIRAKAYDDIPLPIGQGQFDPAPSVVAEIAAALAPSKSDAVLVVGVGSGYIPAVLSNLAAEVAVTDVNQVFLYQAMAIFELLKLKNIQARLRDGVLGWEPPRIFDAIVVNGSVNHIPDSLVRMLRIGGKMVIPLGNAFGVQNLVVITRTEEGISLKTIGEVIFPPLKGKALEQSDKNEYPYPYEGSRDNTLAYFHSAP